MSTSLDICRIFAFECTPLDNYKIFFMKFDKFLSVACAAVLLLSCNNESLEFSQNQNEPSQESVEVTIGDEVKGYAESLETLTGLLYTAGKQSDFEKFLNYNLPEIGALGKLDIKDATGAPIKFADLPENEQKLFIHHIALYMAKVQTDKIFSPQLNSTISTIINAYNAMSDIVEKLLNKGKSFEVIVARISEEIGKSNFLLDNTDNPAQKADTKALIGFGTKGSQLSFDYYKQNLAGKAKKGDIGVIIPIQGQPLTLMNLPEQIAYFIDGGTHHRSIGHSGILTKDITQDMSFADKNTVDSIMFVANGKGVCFEQIDSWLTEQYILEIKKLEYTWDAKSKEPLKVDRVSHSPEEINRFMEKALSYEGYPFIEDVASNYFSGYFFNKDYMPDAFTCVGLIWWTALETYGIDMSIPFLRTISPGRLILNPYTDIVTVLE